MIDYGAANGILGSIFYTLMLIPQIGKTWRLGQSEQLSYMMLLCGVIASATSAIYAFTIDSDIFVVSNTLYFISCTLLASMKFFMERKKKAKKIEEEKKEGKGENGGGNI